MSLLIVGCDYLGCRVAAEWTEVQGFDGHAFIKAKMLQPAAFAFI